MISRRIVERAINCFLLESVKERPPMKFREIVKVLFRIPMKFPCLSVTKNG